MLNIKNTGTDTDTHDVLFLKSCQCQMTKTQTPSKGIKKGGREGGRVKDRDREKYLPSIARGALAPDQDSMK